ncbi:MAG: hypothetical protein AB7E80_05400 [Hyphomicrobiaceae bacterium]
MAGRRVFSDICLGGLTFFSLLLMWFAVSANPAGAGGGKALEGRKTIRVVDASGSALEIGHVTFTPTAEGGAAKIAVVLDGPDFKDEFLSMRPFRCIGRPKQMWCHLAYPYPIVDQVSMDDLRDLEYRLLFLWRPYDKVGVDAWNGLYFKLEPHADGSIVGRLNEADFNVLAVPPGEGVMRPVTHKDLTEAQPGQHAFDRIEIR